MTTLRTAYGALLRRDRLAAGLTQRELAHRVGVTHTYISHAEAGRYIPSEATYTRIAEELGANVSKHGDALGWHRCPSCRRLHRRDA